MKIYSPCTTRYASRWDHGWKMEDKARFVSVLYSTRIKQGQTGWNCVNWLQEALQGFQNDWKAMGKGVLEWTRVGDRAMEYCRRKKNEHRFDGQGSYDPGKAPTYDLVEGKEMIV